jgi:hypothetical protein
MKISFAVVSLVAALVLPVSADDTELGKKMDELNDHYKSIRREDDPAKGAVSAREAQKLIAASLDMTPAMLTQMKDGPAKQNALAIYRQMMGQSYVLLCQIEQAYLAKDMDKAKELYEQLKSVRSDGHDKFIEE